MAVRDLGRAIVNAVTSPTTLPTVVTGNARVVTAFVPQRATDPISQGQSKVETPPDRIAQLQKRLPKLVRNPLEEFASYNCLWTLACLTPEQFNNPPSYRNNPADLKNIVMASAGRFDEQRTKIAGPAGDLQAPEYFINSFSMKATIAANEKTGNSNAFKFDFEIYEPYSMGLLLQSLQVAANQAGYINYLNNAPYVLRLDIMGFDELGQEYKTIKPKFFVMKLTSCKFSVNEAGSTYKMEAVPYNHQGFSDIINSTFNDVKITLGDKGTVEEALVTGPESLTKVLNDIEKRLKDTEQITEVDVYDIQFPTNSSDFKSQTPLGSETKATVDPKQGARTVIKGSNVEAKDDLSDQNPIATSDLGFDQSNGGNFVMKKNDKKDPKTGLISRDKMTIDPKRRTFQFAQGQTLTAIINQVILSSKYAKDAINPKNAVNGFIKWWRIDVQIELLKFDYAIGDFAKKITFRVVPFLVHESIFKNPNSAPNYDNLQQNIAKGYEYIYTGQNVDLLKFDININNLFYAGVNSSSEKDTAQGSDPNRSGVAEDLQNTTQTPVGTAPGAQLATGGRARPKRDPDELTKAKGGTGFKDTEKAVAENFHKVFIKAGSADLITANIEILGDTYWIVDSGFANYFAQPSADNPQATADGTMNYEAGDVYIYLAFKTPMDINEVTGLYDFQNLTKESPFSGIYRVTMCESIFSEGVFKQKLTVIRMPGQSLDYQDKPAEINSQITASEQDSYYRQPGKAEAPRTGPNTEDKVVNGSEGE